MIRRYALAIALSVFSAMSWTHATPGAVFQLDSAAQGPAAPSSGTSTRLADGRSLIVGDESHNGATWIWDPESGTSQPTSGSMQIPRSGHTATLLPDGTVLIIGGRHDGATVASPELYDPATHSFTLLPIVGATARAEHTATLTTNGRVLVTGGSDGRLMPLPTEVWDVAARTATTIGSSGINRIGHSAALTADGEVLVNGGSTLDRVEATGPEQINPISGATRQVKPKPERSVPVVTGSIPESRATDIPLDAHIALRFSDALSMASLTSNTIMLNGPEGVVDARIVPAENGRLAFVWPVQRFSDNATYVVTVSGAIDRFGVPVVPASMTFTTVRLSGSPDSADDERWEPEPGMGGRGWRSNRPASPWQKLAPLQAPPGVTALAGQTLRLNGEPLVGVTVEIDDHVARTDATGRFLIRLDDAATGHEELWIDGATARRGSATYGSYEVGVSIVAGKTTALPYTVWMPVIDTAHAVKISSPTATEVVVSTPLIPGLELRIPPHTAITDHHGKPVKSISITPVPLDRPPFPLPAGVEVPLYFTTQPGGAYLSVAGATTERGARLIYPNGLHLPAGTAVNFWRYEPDGSGWEVYGLGRVTADRQQVIPDPGVEVYEFTGAMVAEPGLAPYTGSPQPGKMDGDPVDLFTGLFVLNRTDIALPDVIPIALTRTYRQADSRSRAFGIGATHPYDQFLVGDTSPYTYIDLIVSDGGRIHFDRVSTGTSYTDAVYEHVATPTEWYKASIAWNGTGWTLTKKNGTVLTFREGFLAARPQLAALTKIQDRFGNVVTLTRDADANLTQIRSPHGRWIALTYDSSFRITQIHDNSGRTVGYTYDAAGRLWKVTDPEGGVTEYTYDTSHRMLTLKDARGIVFLTNQYDTADRVVQQTLSTGGTYQFAYSVDGQGRKVTDVTNPRGFVQRTTFNGDGYPISEVEAVGTAVERTRTTTRQAGSNFVTAVVDGLNRQTAYTYDTAGRVLTLTRLAGTPDAVTTTFTYESAFGQLATVTDPLNHTWTVGYSSSRPISLTDPMSHQTTLTTNAAGQVTSVTDPLSHTWQFGYTDGDATSTTNPVGAVTTQFVDAAGRVTTVTDPLGRTTRTSIDKLNRVTAVTDPLGGQISFAHDANGNLLSLKDALAHETSYAYDTSDRVATRTDPLTHTASFQYDLNGNLNQTTDRKSQVTTKTYDALDRLGQVTFADSSTISYTYDAGDRLTQIVDSANGTITRTFDGLDRLTQEVTPQGTVAYTYDAAGRRATMTVAGQTAVTYTYDNANRLLSVAQGTAVVTFTYDNANRRSTLTYPNGIVATYGYDNASQLTSLMYTSGQTTLGSLTYTYDMAGQRIGVGGSWARTGYPQALTSATYDAANRILTWGGTSFTYDANGNVTGDGVRSYTWNARDQLTALTGGATASFGYDAMGRRQSKTISGTSTGFVYDGMNLVQELTGGGVTTVTFLTGLGLDEMFTRTENTATSTFLTDALGSTLALADATGALQTDYTYDPFGETSTSGVTSTNAVQFTGRENDGVGLYFYRSRFYNPMSHRFISTDPLGLAAGVNLYAYVLNAPTIHVDPLGQQSVTPFPWWYWFFKVLNMEPPMPVDLAEQAHTIEEATKVGEKGIEEANKHVERRRETIKDLCAQDPSWPYCKSDDPNKPDPPKKKSKSDDPDQEPNSPW